MLKRFLPAAALLAVLAVPAQAQAASGKPRLVVLVSVDQMRGDYPADYGRQWSRGLKTLFERGAYFRNAAYPYLHTVTCPGHFTIGTGAFPHRHGMVLNGWWDEAQKKVVPCTTDPAARNVPYGGAAQPTAGGHSAHFLKVPTFADAMKAQLRPTPRVFSASIKPRSAIGLVGAAGDVVTFHDHGAFVTSSVYATAPDPAVKATLDALTPESLVARPWDRVLAAGRYRFIDAAPFEKPPVGFWTNRFPHPLRPPAAAGGSPPGLQGWSASPMTDDALLALAKTAVSKMRLGRGNGTDLLAISFSALDTVGHAFGPHSHEVQDAMIRLDRVLGDLLTTLDRSVGRDRYVLALTADHGVAAYPEALLAVGQDAGRISMEALEKQVEQAITVELGEGEYVSKALYTDVYLAPGVFDRLKQKPGAVTRVAAAIRAIPGVAAAFSDDQLRDPARLTDPVARAAAFSHFPGRSGHFVLAPKANWLTTPSGTTHGTHHGYDQRVPVVLYGAGVRRGRYAQPATPADIAPTLAAMLGVALPTAEGRVLSEALTGAGRGQRR